MPEKPETRYQQELAHNGFSDDPAQALAIRHLQALYDQLVTPKASPLKKAFQLWFPKKETPLKGLYLWGGVGRGKTWLMDLFYESLPFEHKTRMHFHHFMKYVHEELRSLAGVQNPLQQIASGMAKKSVIICFDEFFVSDITDAMILAGLLEALFKKGVILVTTSNVAPDNLYKDGLQRVRFLPAIDLLNTHTTVLNIDGGTDYRLRILEQATTYYTPLNQNAQAHLAATFDSLVSGTRYVETSPITLLNRPIHCVKRHEGIGWFLFEALCDGPRSQNDYMELACLFHTVLLEGLPELDESKDDQARRFISLVDEFYDRNVTLILSAYSPINEIYTGSRLAFEFQRTASRLHEMQSKEFLARTHIAG
ncbi:cell division protein ZapE [Endozoicomonas sp. Mp262]|uniref:cell division protein ZapE n=1 Tax=Endozoicomonas sp. Mp262 TaxID=2919499 RepID=UPI0021D9DB7A